MLKETRNTYDVAVAVSFCLAATNQEEVSFGGGLVATIYRLDQNGSDFLDFLGRDSISSDSLPSFFAGLWKLKSIGDSRWDKDGKYEGSTFSEIEPEQRTVKEIALGVRQFLYDNPMAANAGDQTNVAKILQRIADKGDEAYDDWYGNNGEIKKLLVARSINSTGLENLKKIETKSTQHVELTNGALESRSSLPMLVLGSIDQYIKQVEAKNEEDLLTVNDQRFPSLIASAMYEASLFKPATNKDNSNLANQIDNIARNIDDEKRNYNTTTVLKLIFLFSRNSTTTR